MRQKSFDIIKYTVFNDSTFSGTSSINTIDQNPPQNDAESEIS